MLVFEGQINELIARNSKESESLPCKTSNFSDISAISNMSTKSSYSRFAPEMQAAISSITGIDFKDDIDMPPDILELCDEDEMQKFINSHPGCENDERTDSGIGTATRLFNYSENDGMTAELCLLHWNDRGRNNKAHQLRG